MNADDSYHGEGNHRMADEDYADKTELLLDIIDSLESGNDRYHFNDIIIIVKNYMSSLHDYVIIINNEIIIRDTTNTIGVNNHNHSHTHEYDNDNHNRDDKVYKLCQNYFIIKKLLIIISSKVSSLTTDHLKLWKVFHQHFKQYHQHLSIHIIFDYCQLLHMYLIDGLYNLQQYVNHQHHHQQQQQHHQYNQHCKIDKHHDINSSNNTIIHDNSYGNSNDDNNRNDYNSSKKLISFFLVRYMYIMSMYRLPLSQLLTSSSSSSSLLMDSIITLLRYQGIISYIHSLSSFNTNTTSTTYTSTTITTTTINNNDDDSLIYNANDIVICDELFMKNFEYICKLLHYNHHNDDDDHQGRKHNNGGISDDNARYDSTNSNKLLLLLRCIQHKSNNWIEDKTKLSYLIDGVMLLLQYIMKKENSIRRKEKEEILTQRRNDNDNVNNDDGKDYNKDDGSGYIYECIYIFLQSMRFHCLFIDNNNTSNGVDSKNINNNYDDISDDGMLIKYIKQFIKLLARFMGSCDDHNSIRRLMVSKS